MSRPLARVLRRFSQRFANVRCKKAFRHAIERPLRDGMHVVSQGERERERESERVRESGEAGRQGGREAGRQGSSIPRLLYILR